MAATTYEVGPGKPLANVGDVPWESLDAGDTVLIYYRATPYKEKFVLVPRRHPGRADHGARRARARTASGPSSTATAPPRAPSSTTRAACAA